MRRCQLWISLNFTPLLQLNFLGHYFLHLKAHCSMTSTQIFPFQWHLLYSIIICFRIQFRTLLFQHWSEIFHFKIVENEVKLFIHCFSLIIINSEVVQFIIFSIIQSLDLFVWYVFWRIETDANYFTGFKIEDQKKIFFQHFFFCLRFEGCFVWKPRFWPSTFLTQPCCSERQENNTFFVSSLFYIQWHLLYQLIYWRHF